MMMRANLSALPDFEIEFQSGNFLVKTIQSPEELRQTFLLRFQAFQVEGAGSVESEGEDFDEFDAFSHHLGIFNLKSGQMTATCRLNCSTFSQRFYSEQEFQCATLIRRPENKLEIGRVCVHKDYRTSGMILILWRAIAQYMVKTQSTILFGCGSVLTLDPLEAVILYKHLEQQGKIIANQVIPTAKYRCKDFDLQLQNFTRALTREEELHAESLIPSLCKFYLNIGCKIAGIPAFDREFKCIDFLTILETNDLNPKLQAKYLLKNL
jgi:putative hemolysin